MSVEVTKRKVFKQESFDHDFFKNGFFQIPFLNEEEISSLKKLCDEIPLSSARGDFSASIYLEDKKLKQETNVEIISVVKNKVADVLVDYRILFANFLVKKPGNAGEVGVHQDWSFVDEELHTPVTFWIPLVDTNENNGCIFVFSRSHALGSAVRFSPFEEVAEAALIKEFCKPVFMNAGSALIYHSRLFHFSGHNNSNEIRAAVGFVAVPKEAKALHYFLSKNNGERIVEKFEVEDEFFQVMKPGEKPEKAAEKKGVFSISPTGSLRNDILKLVKRNDQQTHAQNVSKYYDEWNERYMNVYGEVIQAYRPAKEEELLNYTISSAGLRDGMKILDAGCGVCGPAIYFAKKLNLEVEALTISEEQVNLANKKILQENVHQNVRVQKADYHFLDTYFPAENFDAVLFLESLGHAADPAAVIEGAYKVLKFDGFIYIKDFFPREVKAPALQHRIEKTIENMNRAYNYNTLDLHSTISTLRKAGFAIEFIKKPQFESDTSVRAAFESKFAIDVFVGGQFMVAEWLEIKCTKPHWVMQ